MDWSTGFWGAVGFASVVATALATAAAVMVSAWWRRVDRREADWVFLSPDSTWSPQQEFTRPEIPPGLDADLANAGDGTAFRVRVEGVHCFARLQSLDVGAKSRRRTEVTLKPAIHPDGMIHLRVLCDPRLWSIAEVHVIWIRSPTWRKRRSRRVQRELLQEIAPRPRYTSWTFDREKNQPDRVELPEPDLPPLSAEQHKALEKKRPRRRLLSGRGES